MTGQSDPGWFLQVPCCFSTNLCMLRVCKVMNFYVNSCYLLIRNNKL